LLKITISQYSLTGHVLLLLVLRYAPVVVVTIVAPYGVS